MNMDEETLSLSKSTKRAMHAGNTRHFTAHVIMGVKRPNLYGKRSLRCWPVLPYWSQI